MVPLDASDPPRPPIGVRYDAVVVGARVAGAATALLLARAGARVLLVDRVRRGSDTLSSHALMRSAVHALARWGVLDEVRESGAPLVTRTTFRYGGAPVTFDGLDDDLVPGLVAPRRSVLDAVLVAAAERAGVTVRHGVRFVGPLTDAGGRVRGARLATDDRDHDVASGIVIGADGLHSTVARAVGAPVTHEGRYASAYLLRYVQGCGLADDTYEWAYAPGLGAGAIPTNDGAWCVFVAVPPARFRREARSDTAAAMRRLLPEVDGALAHAVAAGAAVGPVRAWPGQVGRFRRPHGPGWALVGDAGYFKDPFAAHGISDAFRDAELLADAVVHDGLDAYERERDERSRPLFDVLERIASYEWDLTALPTLHRALARAMRADESAVRR